MRIVIAPDSFKEALGAAEVCRAIARGVGRVHADASIEMLPMADGGEGTVDALLSATAGRLVSTPVCGPLGRPVRAYWGLLGDGSNTAILEMAAASGLALAPPAERNPLHTTTFGTGELIRAALNAGATRILMGIGGSATTDGGVGAAAALGVRFLDEHGQLAGSVLPGGMLDRIASIDLTRRDPRIARTPITVACDVDNPLCGPRGAAHVFGPQKGASSEDVLRLDRNLAHLAALIERDLGLAVSEMPGAGAAGGLGAGLTAFFGASLQSGVQMVMDALRLRERIAGADLVITGEGRLDAQSLMGKVIAGVGRLGREAGVPVVALVGCTGPGADETLEVLRSFHVINPPGTPAEQALPNTAAALEETAARLTAQWIRPAD